MQPINKEQFCKDVHDFIKEHISEIHDSDLGFRRYVKSNLKCLCY